jgi:competence protein ComEA
MDRSTAPWRVLEDAGDEPASRPADQSDAGRRAASRWLPAAAIGIAAILGLAAVWITVSGSHPSVDVSGAEAFGSAASGDASAGAAAAIGGLLVVDVQGAVAHPGVIKLVAGSRVGDAIAAAGGYGPRVDAERVGSSLNLAAPLHDGDQVVVPSRDDVAAGPSSHPAATGGGSSGGAAGGGSGPIDLNTATAEQLDALPGIGPVTAAKILAGRDEQRFASVDDLRTRKLVGAATFDKIKDLVTVH